MPSERPSGLIGILRPGRSVFACLCLCALLAAGPSCRAPDARPPVRPNLLLVTFDTTRWDHVGYAGGKPGVTPMIDAMATRGTWFSQAITAQPLTVPAHTTIMTGQYPYHHGVRNNGTYIVPDQAVTLAERLKSAGYQTFAAVSAFVLDSQFGLDQGFDVYDDDLSGGPKQKMFMFKEVRAEQTAAKGALWLRSSWKREAPFFMWLHFFDPHADYEAPADIAARFPGDPYSAEIAYADRELGRVFKELDALGVLEDTVVVFTADHGESLGEHGEKTHGLFIYDATTHVPLFLAGPGVPRGKRVDPLVRTADIVPTVLALLRLPAAEGIDGRPLQLLWDGSADERWAYLETLTPRQNLGWAELRGLRTGRYKAIDAPRKEFYELSRDPGERHNAVERSGEAEAGESSTGKPIDLEAVLRSNVGRSGDPELVSTYKALSKELARLREEDPLNRGEQGQASISQETKQKLSALGYVWDAAASTSGPLPDPKDRIGFWERFQATQGLIRQKRYPEAVAAIKALLAEDPGNIMARSSLAAALSHVGEKEKALEVYRDLMVRDPQRETAYLGAAKLLRELKRFDEAEALVRKVIAMQPENPEGYTELGDTFLDQAKYTEAETWFRKALEVDAKSMLAAAGLGNCLNRAGRLKEAARVLDEARHRDPTSHAVTYNLAVVIERLGDAKTALALYQAALKLDPDHSMTWNNLGSLLDKSGKRAEALGRVRKAVELDPENAEATYNLGALTLAAGQPAEALRWLEAAIRLQPQLVPAHLMRARALESLGRVSEAVASLRALAAQVPQAWLSVARLELKRGDRAAAKAALEEGIRRDGERFRAAALRDEALKGLIAGS